MSNILYFFSDAFKGLKRNFTVTFASIFTVVATLFIFGVFMMIANSTKLIVRNVENKIEVRAFMVKNFTPEQKNAVEKKIHEQFGVTTVEFESAKDAFEKAKQSMAEYLKDRDPETNNPFPASFIVKLDKAEYIPKFVENIKGTPGVEDVGNQSEAVDKIVALSKSVKVIGLIVTTIFILLSLFLIGNTIKLAVFGRKKEIEIMKFVGATNWFIRWPHILEGIIIGLLGALIAVALLYFGYRYTYVAMHQKIPFITIPDPAYIKNTLSWQFALGGTLIGALGSFLAIRKHLNV